MKKREQKIKNRNVWYFFVFFVGVAILLSSFLYFHFSKSEIAMAANLRVGVIGDSNSDEYRADDNRAGGTQYAETSLSWVELLDKYKGLDFGPWGTWGGERRSGYKYNWARSAATTQSMIANGQHTGLAQQIANGEIDYAFIFIGTNDFHSWNGTYDEVYNNTMSDAALQAKVDSIVSNITLAVDTMKSAGNVKIVLANFTDPAASVDFMQKYPVAGKRQRVTNAINLINQRLDQLATSRQIAIADMSTFGTSTMSRVDTKGNINVGGEFITAVTHGDEPHHLQLGDSVGHLGTVGSGLLANFLASSLNRSYNLPYTPFSDQEILANAGIGSVVRVTPTPVATTRPTPSPVVLPASPTPTLRPTAVPTVKPTIIPSPTPKVTPKPSATVNPTVAPQPTQAPTGSTPAQRTVLRNRITTFYQEHKADLIQALARIFIK